MGLLTSWHSRLNLANRKLRVVPAASLSLIWQCTQLGKNAKQLQ